MSYSFLGAEDPCADMSWFERWFTPNCDIARANAADEPAVSRGMFDGIRINNVTYNCEMNAAGYYDCGSWAEGQGLVNAFGRAKLVRVMGEARPLVPGTPSPDGTVRTSSTREQSIANALALRGGISSGGVIALLAGGAVALGAVTFLTTRKRKRR